MLKIEFIKMPLAVAQSDLSDKAKILLSLLYTLQQTRRYAGGYDGGRAELAETLKWSVRTLDGIIAELKEAGQLTAKRFRTFNGGTGVCLKLQELASSKLQDSVLETAKTCNIDTPDSASSKLQDSATSTYYVESNMKKEKEEKEKNTPDPQGEAAAKKPIETLCMEIRSALRPEDCMAIYGKAYDMVMADLDAFKRHLEIGGETTMAQARFNNRFRRFCKGGSDTAPKSGSFDERKQVHRSDYDEPISDIEF